MPNYETKHPAYDPDDAETAFLGFGCLLGFVVFALVLWLIGGAA